MKLVNENLNEFLGLSIEEKIKNLDPKDEKNVNNLFKRVFKYILINPNMSIIGQKADGLSSEEKYELIKKYVEYGSGTLRLKNGNVVCIPEKK